MDLSKRDILSALGIEAESSFWTTALVGFGVGCLVGAAVAILVTPKSGRELRADIAERGRDLIGRGREEVGVGIGKNPTAPTY
jgi:hypothetical protein